MLSNHNINCQQCDKNGKCELLHVASVTGAREGRYQGSKTPTTFDQLTPTIVRDTSKCILCGRCVARCQNAHGKDMGILGFENRGFNTIVAPAVRAALGEEFGMKIGTPVTGKMVAALRRLGFKKVFDTNFAADLTIMEEGTELLGRIQNGGTLPMITSCSPGWVFRGILPFALQAQRLVQERTG